MPGNQHGTHPADGYASASHGKYTALWCLVSFTAAAGTVAPDHRHACIMDLRKDHKHRCQCGAEER